MMMMVLTFLLPLTAVLSPTHNKPLMLKQLLLRPLNWKTSRILRKKTKLLDKGKIDPGHTEEERDLEIKAKLVKKGHGTTHVEATEAIEVTTERTTVEVEITETMKVMPKMKVVIMRE
jgi:hypothetical protein